MYLYFLPTHILFDIINNKNTLHNINDHKYKNI